MRHQPALAADEAHDVLLRIFPGKAHGHQRLQTHAAHALRRKHPLVVPDAVHHLPADKQPGRAAAAQMQHDEPAVSQRLVQHLAGAAHGHGAAVQRMSRHHPGQLRQTGHPRLIGHLVHRDRVADKGGDAERPGDPQRQHAAQIGRVRRVPHGVHKVHHVLIHLIGARRAVGQLPAPGADRIQRSHIHLLLRQRLFDGLLAEVRLLHDPREGLQVLPAVAQRLVEYLFRAAEQRELRGGRAGIDDQYTLIHSDFRPRQGSPSFVI